MHCVLEPRRRWSQKKSSTEPLLRPGPEDAEPSVPGGRPRSAIRPDSWSRPPPGEKGGRPGASAPLPVGPPGAWSDQPTIAGQPVDKVERHSIGDDIPAERFALRCDSVGIRSVSLPDSRPVSRGLAGLDARPSSIHGLPGPELPPPGHRTGGSSTPPVPPKKPVPPEGRSSTAPAACSG